MNNNNIINKLKSIKRKKIFCIMLLLISLTLIITGIILYSTNLAMRIILYASIAILLISIIGAIFYSFSYGDFKNMYKVYNLIALDNILFIDELSNIFGLGTSYIITIVNRLMAEGYLQNYVFNNAKELKHLDYIVVNRK